MPERHDAVIAEMLECADASDPSIWGDERIAGLVENSKRQQIAYCDRLEAALKHERDTWLEKIHDAHEIADQFKETLDNLLNQLFYVN